MPILYVQTGCGFCARTLAAAQGLGIELDIRNIADEAFADELVARGGKRQEPYLVDEANGVEMYESDDIVAHLNAHFSPATEHREGPANRTRA